MCIRLRTASPAKNPEFGDCLLPGDPGALTGGSSSGAASPASLEGSAVAAIGTDTGGSVRVPASLGGLAGYRSSLGRGNWRGGAHLAESFDTLGWPVPGSRRRATACRLLRTRCSTLRGDIYASSDAIIADSFLEDCEPHRVMASYRSMTIRELQSRSASKRAPSIQNGGPNHAKSSRAFKRGRLRDCTSDITIAFSRPSASGLKWARALHAVRDCRAAPAARRFQRPHGRSVRNTSS